MNRLFLLAYFRQSNSCISQNKLMASIRKLYERILMFKSETRSFQDSEKGNSQIIAAMVSFLLPFFFFMLFFFCVFQSTLTFFLCFDLFFFLFFF